MIQTDFSAGYQNIQGLHNENLCKMNEMMDDLSCNSNFGGNMGCKCEHEIEDSFVEFVPPQKHLGLKRGVTLVVVSYY